MKNILYLTMAPIDESSGVYKKVISQSRAFRRQGYAVKILFVRDIQQAYIYEEGRNLQAIDLQNKHEVQNIVEYIKKCAFCYSRFELLRHKNFSRILKFCRKNKIDIITEIPTYPPYQESLARVRDSLSNKKYLAGLKTLLGTLFVVLDVYITVFFSKLMVLVADDNKFLLGNSVRIENGVDMENVQFSNKMKEDTLNIVGVSNFSVWNGYDRAIRGLENYIRTSGRHDIKLTFVGDLTAGKSLVELAAELNVSDDVIFTGSLSGCALDEAYSKADIALCALGNHRRKVFANSSLKAKEYSSHGMIMIMSDAEGIEKEIKEKSFLVKSNESAIDFVEIKKWFENIEDLKDVRSGICNFAKEHFTWDSQIEKIIVNYNKLS